MSTRARLQPLAVGDGLLAGVLRDADDVEQVVVQRPIMR
jgi:hypothetical protein